EAELTARAGNTDEACEPMFPIFVSFCGLTEALSSPCLCHFGVADDSNPGSPFLAGAKSGSSPPSRPSEASPSDIEAIGWAASDLGLQLCEPLAPVICLANS